jgi:hypothetical protein
VNEGNLFTMLSAYRPGSAASPFENYCTSAVAHFLQRGNRMLAALFTAAARAEGSPIAMVEVQPPFAGGEIVDLVITFEGGKRAVVEVEVEPRAHDRRLPQAEDVAGGWGGPAELVFLGLPGSNVPHGWESISWLDVAEALAEDPDSLAQQFVEFVHRDILGLGEVALDEALATNRLYALGGAVLRRRFGERARYVNSASRAVGGRYRYIGTTFALDEGEMEYWVGLVNEALPLTEHYHLMIASKHAPVASPASAPRATGDWKWAHWAGLGRVVRPLTVDAYEELLERLR